MEFRAIMPMLKVTDFERPVHFYHDEYGTLEFAIRDPDGYTLAFSEQRAG